MPELPNVDDNLPKDQARLMVDEAIQQHQTAIVALKSRRNTLSPISVLPTEILCKIFSIVRNKNPRRLQAWLGLTHVSRHWRSIGIGSPCLWTFPPVNNFVWIEIMLRRSKEIPLIVETNGLFPERGTLPGLKQLLEQGQRIKRINLCLSVQQWQELRRLFPKSTPQLEELSLFVFNVDRGMDSDVIFGANDVLCETPRLQHLELFNLRLDWNTHLHLLHGLTHLTLQYMSSNTQVTWKLFTEALKGMPDLQNLHLEHSLPTNISKEISWAPVNLHSLEVLDVHCEAKAVETLLSCIAFPSTTQTRVSCLVTPPASADFTGLLAQLSQTYSNMFPDQQFITLVLVEPLNEVTGLGVKFFVEALSWGAMLDDEVSPHLECMFSWHPGQYDGPQTCVKAMNDIFNCGLPLQNIDRVYLTNRRQQLLRPDTLATTVGKLVQLKYFMVSNNSSKTFVHALECVWHVDDPNTGLPVQRYYFPNLSAICFYESTFCSPFSQGLWNRDVNSRHHISLERLVACLNERSMTGAPLSHISLRRCSNLFAVNVGPLRAAVHTFEWDEGWEKESD